jgi:hypothetical protein
LNKEVWMRYLKIVVVGVVAAIVAFAAFAPAARAAEGDQPLLALDRLTFAGGVNYAWHAAPMEDSAPVPAFGKEWEAGLYAAYNLTPKLSLAGSSVYGFDNKMVETRVGLRVRFGRGE